MSIDPLRRNCRCGKPIAGPVVRAGRLCRHPRVCDDCVRTSRRFHDELKQSSQRLIEGETGCGTHNGMVNRHAIRTQHEVARLCGWSDQRVQRLERSAIFKIRQSRALRKLWLEYLEASQRSLDSGLQSRTINFEFRLIEKWESVVASWANEHAPLLVEECPEEHREMLIEVERLKSLMMKLKENAPELAAPESGPAANLENEKAAEPEGSPVRQYAILETEP